MAREKKKINNRYYAVVGTDHVLGYFIQIVDLEFVGYEKDFSGDGYVFDWDMMFGTSISSLVDEKGNPYRPSREDKSATIIDFLKKTLASGKIFNKFDINKK